MLLLYIDESGGFDGDQQYGVFGGIAVHIADLYDIRAKVEAVMAAWLDEHNRAMEIHASDMRTGSGKWRKIPREVRHSLLAALLELIGTYQSPEGRPYGLLAVARAPHAVPSADPLERSFQELIYHFASAMRSFGADTHGVVIADEARYERVIQPLVARWQSSGDARKFWRLRPLARVAEIPLFADSKATRLLQLADLVAHAVFSYYERGDGQLIGPLLRGFVAEGGVMHGLMHLTPTYRLCPCPGCMGRLVRDRMRTAADATSRIEDDDWTEEQLLNEVFGDDKSEGAPIAPSEPKEVLRES